jgi:hypothetical protein
MNEAPPAEQPARSGRLGCLLRLAIAVVAMVGLVIAIGTIFNQGKDADQPASGYDAGPAVSYQPATVNQIEPQHLFVTRLQDGTFVALYDRSSRQQELHGDCRVVFDDTAGIGLLEPLPGITGGFVETCDDARAVWRADGEFAFGSGYGNLDRFPTSVDGNGHLIIQTDTRTCTRSKGVIGVPPFVEQQCGAGD